MQAALLFQFEDAGGGKCLGMGCHTKPVTPCQLLTHAEISDAKRCRVDNVSALCNRDRASAADRPHASETQATYRRRPAPSSATGPLPALIACVPDPPRRPALDQAVARVGYLPRIFSVSAESQYSLISTILP